MKPHIYDFSHLSPAERIELAMQLWDSLEPTPLVGDETLATNLRQRRAELCATEGQDVTTVERGSGNVFADLGFPDADERLAKAELARALQPRAP